jgi:eukaryotic-like serine/threonine-protein kinase
VATDLWNIVGTVQEGTFKIEEVIAEGGFAVVYRAHHTAFRADVALKCLKVPGTLSEEGQHEFLEKFREEAELLFRLSSSIPGIVRPLHVGTLGADSKQFVPFIAMEWLSGETLDRVIQNRREQGKAPLNLERTARLLGPAARALERAHKFPGPNGVLSVLHRDLKPENLFVAKVHGEETVKILDFGIGKVKSAATQIAGRLSAQEGQFSAFTPAYAAPEQWVPKRYGQTGTWTDVWGFSLVVLETLLGRTPLDGDAPAIMGAAIDEVERPTPRSFGLEVPEQLERAFARALAVDPTQRYHDVGEFWDVMEAVTGVRTPRVAVAGSSLDSMPPPASPRPEAPAVPVVGKVADARPAAATEIAASPSSKALASAPVPNVPELDLGLPPPASKKAPARAAPRPASSYGDLDDALVPTSAPVSRGRASSRGASSQGGAGMGGIGGFRLDTETPMAGVGLATAPSRAAKSYARRPEPIQASSKVVMDRWSRPLKWLAFALIIVAADYAYTTLTGSPIRIGPARPLWVAGPLVVIALVTMVLSLIHHED